MNKTLIDNSANLKMVNVLKECISQPEMDTIRIATGYWDIPGTALVVDEVQEFLNGDNAKLKLLIGKDPYVYAKMLKEPKFQNKTYPNDFIRTNINELADNLLEEYKQVINLLLKFCAEDNKKIEIRIFKKDEDDDSQFFHSKCYIFTSDDDDNKPMSAIVGSSNFTQKGLEGNAELNVLETDPYMIAAPIKPTRKGHITWFEEKWAQAEDWTQEFLEQILKTSKPVEQMKTEDDNAEEDKPLTPYELYIKLLQKKFGDIVDLQIGQQIESYLPQRYDRYAYQIDAVKQCYSTMKDHGGFLLADVVGLGKTIVGTLLIKHFLQMPDDEGREPKVLIITPPAIQSSWLNTIAEFDKDSAFKIEPFIDFITTGSIGKLTDEEDIDDGDHDTGVFGEDLKHKNYGLIIVDESHKFRNSGTAMYEALDNLIKTIGSEIGAYPYIGLLSATPQNNRPSDLQNQIYLFERNRDVSTLKKANGGNLNSFFREVNAEFEGAIHQKVNGEEQSLSKEELHEKLKDVSFRIRECILNDIMIRRTRTDVMRYYKDDLTRSKISFPTIEGPISLKYRMSRTLSRLFYDSMMCIAPDILFGSGLMYYRYRAIQYFVKAENRKKYEARGSRDADALAEQLAKIMQMNLVKRLESSFTAFKQSLLNLKQYTQNMIDMWEKDAIFICPQFNVNSELDRKAKEKKRGHHVSLEDCFADIRNRIKKLNDEGRNDDESNMEYHREDFDPDYIDLLRQDYEIISNLCDRWAKNCEDPKFDEFKETLRPTLFNPNTNQPQKLVIFTESIDTADSIERAAESKGYSVLKITASNRNEMEDTIRENFDANYKGEWKNDYNVIVTTDVLAEGINLHRANCILNYDTPWNSTRLMQRIGRVNRIGSTENKIYVYNFMPSAEGDNEINLVQKAHAKLQSFHTLFGEDSQVFSGDEEVSHYDLNTQVNGEESPLEKYVYELKQYKEQHPARYEFIERQEDGLSVTSSSNGDSYFYVATPKMRGMFVRIAKNAIEGETITLLEGIGSFKVDVEAESKPLPDNWSELCEEAERVVTAELASVKSHLSNTPKATDAKGIIIQLKKNQRMSNESKKLLNKADALIRKGNMDIVNAILKVDEAMKDRGQLFKFTQDDFDFYISTQISNLVSSVAARQGKTRVIFGTVK